ncbi:TonB-dependent receptor [Kaistella palustris]|uniref:TonB-dependent receptor n=1 Tax=Kaistella palustris TaxID=493376 RepID=UPI00042743AA|nr:TonB-dependent receptor [Kaistella palustris]
MQKLTVLFFFVFFFSKGFAQDSLQSHHIQEVIVIGTTKVSAKEAKPLSSIDEYLQKSAKIDMIKRGAYAWEPLINNMPTERTLVTIDGMRIFGACTDKMDPVTSYIEVSNLSEAVISSGQQGSSHGSTIGGAIDLKRPQPFFGPEKWNFNISSGFESVNQQKIFGAGTTFKNESFYTDVNFMSRDAENYMARNHTEIPFSQFKKINLSGISGFKFGGNKILEGSLIYDKATDVGYPALPMDVSLAEALITSLKFQVLPQNSSIHSWETKVYYNSVTHRMDDTKRPAVPIHMDMPGWSTTAGYYSQLKMGFADHHFLANLSGYYNKSTAEMTMYPTDISEPLMFMYTWPKVQTFYQGLYLEDHFLLNENSELKFSASVGFHRNNVESDFGLSSLQIFYPEMTSDKNRILKNFAANFRFAKNIWEFGLGAGYGDRAPSVSEGYGFYLFNSFEKYDYIGNPDLKNESSLEANAFMGIKKENVASKISLSYFHISNYIVGEILPGLAPMTIGASGVKKYGALDFADILNISWTSDVKLFPFLKWNTQLVYSRGRDFEKNNLPFMSPFSYSSSLRYIQNKFSAEISAKGNAGHRDFAANYGETETPAYTLANGSIGYIFNFSGAKILAKAGIENIFDKYYTTYSDWNKIPRPGRNFFLNLNINF